MPRIRLAVLVLAVACATPSSADEWKKAYRVDPNADMVVRADDGSVHVDTWNRHDIGVRIVTQGMKIGPNGLRISEQSSRDKVVVEARDPRWSFSIGTAERSTRIEVRLPPGTHLDVGTGDGSVTLENLEGLVRVDTGDGSIVATELKGDLGFHTADGSIRGVSLEGKLTAETGDGSIRISGSFSRLDLETGDGSIDAEAEPTAKPRVGWRLVTGDGSLILRLPEDFEADLDAHTSDGGITLTLPVEVEGTYSHTTIRGTLNGGGAPLQIRSGNGSIRLGKR